MVLATRAPSLLHVFRLRCPTRLPEGRSILIDMNGLTTSAGQLLSVKVAGAPPTVKDAMLSAHLYLTTLERFFVSADALVASYLAHEKELQRGGKRLSRVELSFVRSWKSAHRKADRIARPTLSDPENQEFVLTVAGHKLTI